MHGHVLAMVAVSRALAMLLPQLSSQSVVLLNGNATVVAFLRHQDGTVYRVLCLTAAEVFLWTERRSVSLTARGIPGKNIVLATELSHRDQILPMELSLFSRVFVVFYGVFGHPHLVLFATQANAKLPLYVSPVPDLKAWKQDIFQHPWDHLSAYAFLPFAWLRQVLPRVLLSTGLSLVLVAPL